MIEVSRLQQLSIVGRIAVVVTHPFLLLGVKV